MNITSETVIDLDVRNYALDKRKYVMYIVHNG